MSHKAVELLYGRGTLALNLPADAEATVIVKPPFPPAASAVEVFEQALSNPVCCDSLEALCKGRSSACILICDITRPVPNHVFLQPIIRIMMDNGIAPSNITGLVATGLHRPNEGGELAELVGDPWVLETVTVVDHFAQNDENHVDLGKTKTRGTPVRIDRRFVERDLRIATGLV